MKKIFIHTPEGVRDIYNKECEQKLQLQQRIHSVLKRYGYCDTQTPSIEFFDIFSKEKGTVPANQMYKFFDREGNTLVLRPDMTPPMARFVSKYYMDETMPIRLCYCGQTFINSADHQGKLKEITQIGGELYCENKADSDCEALATVIESLLDSGLTEFQIEVGHAMFFDGLLEEANLSEEDEEAVRELVVNKNFFGLEEYLCNLNISDSLKKVFNSLPELMGSAEVIERAKNMISNTKTLNALSRLEKVHRSLSYYGYEKYVSFDLSIVANRNYYTGIIFAGYTYGTGDAIVTGGRYDNLLKQFGKDTPSIGFAIDLDHLLMAVNRQKIEINMEQQAVLILYDNNVQGEAIAMATDYRKNGKNVTLIRKQDEHSMDAYKEYATRNHFQEMFYFSDVAMQAEKIDF